MGIYVTPATKGLINDIHFGRGLIHKYRVYKCWLLETYLKLLPEP